MTTDNPPQLKRTLNLPLLVLYGLGTTIGAGIYVLVGAAAGRAGIYAPFSFIVAAVALVPTAVSYCELVSRFPVSAGEAAYVEEGFRQSWLTGLVGFMMVLSGVVASAAIAIGCAGYIRSFMDVPLPWLLLAIICTMGAMAAWGILESVLLAALFTLIEAGGLLILVWAGLNSEADLVSRIPMTVPPLDDTVIWLGISNAGLLAVFAFIGFEDMVNVAEETKNPNMTMPAAILITLVLTMLLYTAVSMVAVLAVEPQELARAEAPLSLVFARLTGMSPAAISAIAIFATLNTILIQLIMASRVIYGLASQGFLPKILARVNATTQTPLLATAIVVAVALVLSLWFPIQELAEVTSQIILLIWTLTNGALIAVKMRPVPPPQGAFVVSMVWPVLGVLTALALIIISLIN